MTLTIQLSTESEARLKAAATRLGLEELEYARQIIEKELTPPAAAIDQATLDLLAKWKAEDEASTPEEITEAQRDWEEFKAGMNAHSGRPIYPD